MAYNQLRKKKGRPRQSYKVRDSRKLKGLKDFKPVKIEGYKVIYEKE